VIWTCATDVGEPNHVWALGVFHKNKDKLVIGVIMDTFTCLQLILRIVESAHEGTGGALNFKVASYLLVGS